MKRIVLSGSFFLLLSIAAVTADQYGDFFYTSDGTSVSITDFTCASADVTVPDAIAGLPVTRIGNAAFQSCSNLTGIILPSTITNIGHWAFQRCVCLTNIVIPDSVAALGDWAFDNCTSLVRVVIGEGVTRIGDTAFASCARLIDIAIPARVSSLGNVPFYSCRGLTSIVVAATNAAYSSLDGVLFNKSRSELIECPGGKAGCYEIPNGVAQIRNHAFAGCYGLTCLTIPDSVTTISNSAFYYCINLAQLTVPASVTFLGDWAFNGCFSLTAVYFLGNAPALGGAFIFAGASSAHVYRLPDTTGWDATWAALFPFLPPLLWNPRIVAGQPDAGGISMTVTGTPNIPIAVEAGTNLLAGPFLRILATNLTAGSQSFTDPGDQPARFYRIVTP